MNFSEKSFSPSLPSDNLVTTSGSPSIKNDVGSNLWKEVVKNYSEFIYIAGILTESVITVLDY